MCSPRTPAHTTADCGTIAAPLGRGFFTPSKADACQCATCRARLLWFPRLPEKRIRKGMRNFSSDRFIPTDVLIRFEDGSELVTVAARADIRLHLGNAEQAEPVALRQSPFHRRSFSSLRQKRPPSCPILQSTPFSGYIAPAGVGPKE
jgi:hypothetical protein